MKAFELLFPKDIPLLQTLNDEEMALLCSETRRSEYRKGELVHAHCGNCIGLIYLKEGRACATMLSDEGREAVMFRLNKGEICILSAACILRQVCFDVHLEAECDSSLLIVPTSTVETLMQRNPEFRCELYRMAAVRFSEVLQNLQLMLFGSVEKRIANVLVEESVITGSNEIHLTHEQIARYAGSAREVVSRALKKMTEDGSLRLGRNEITLLRPELLKARE